MKAQITAIRVLTVTAVLLLAAIAFLPDAVMGANSGVITIKDGDYVVATHPVTGGGDALYIADTRLGAIGVFAYDPGARELVLRDVRPILETFGMR